MVSVNREDKIKFVKNDMSKELLDDNLRLRHIRVDMCNVRLIIYGSCSKKKSARFNKNLTLKDHVCHFIRKLDGKPIINP